jgi:uncharacterized protein (TIGR02466 family)
MKQIEVLPQIIYEFQADPKITSLALELLKKEELIQQGNAEGYKVSGMTEDARLNLRPEYADIMDWIHECLDEVRLIKNLQCERLQITQSWGVTTTYNTHQYKHYHTNSYISGVFYLTNSPTGTTLYHNSIWEQENPPLMTVRHLAESRDLTHKVRAKAGTLVLFPSALQHEVRPSKDFGDRYTLVINAFPSGKIGNFRMFNGIEIEIK